MIRQLRMHFPQWVMSSVALLVVVLAAAFLLTVFRTFKSISEEHATARFSLIAERAAGEISGMLRESGKQVLATARADRSQFVQDGKLNAEALVPTFLGSLELDPTLSAHYFGLRNEEFLQVLGIRGDPRIVAALEAPEGSQYAVRRVQRTEKGERTDRYVFLDRRFRPMGQRDQPVKMTPTERPWFKLAAAKGALAVTDAYLFKTTGELGITVAAPLSDNLGVMATDISLQAVDDFLASLRLTPNAAIAVLDLQGRVLGWHGRGERFAGLDIKPMSPASELADPYLAVLADTGRGSGGTQIQRLGPERDEKFIVTRLLSEEVGGAAFRIVILAPLSDFTGAFRKAERDVTYLSVLVLLVLLPLSWAGTRRISESLKRMASDSERMKLLDFSQPPCQPETFLYEINTLGEAQAVMHGAIQKRTGELNDTQDKLENLIQTGIEMGLERDRLALLRKILLGGKNLLHCDAGTLYLVTERKTLSFALRTRDDALPSFEIPLYEADGTPVERYMATWCALHNAPVIVDDVYSETRFDVSGAKRMDAETGYRTVSMLTVPLSPREGEVIGVLQFLNALDPQTGEPVPFPPEWIRFVTAMAAQAAVALNNHQLLEAQEKLMDAMIQLIAGAIDAKSPYTGGHCERVPELAIMLAEAAVAEKSGPLAGFAFKSEAEWREFRVGAWLHDCGKVTTPEYVVDKATKLETIYNRIHEVRTRFEVLLRDAEIERLQAIYELGEDPLTVNARFEAKKAQLQDDFAFLAESNVGGEFMAPERIERVKRLAEQTWLRHFDDRLGLSEDERRRRAGLPPAELPAREYLLTDQPWHVVPRGAGSAAFDPRYGWKVNVPENLYNFGEVYNLCIGRGTLTEEERFKINEHIIQTIAMLEQLPLPAHLKRVPEYAGTHHETMIGTGYPRRLAADELSVPSRIMAIADIFEALTASDRPYKPTKKLSECVKILSFFKKDGHIDPVLFDLFLTSGVYRQYAERYLRPEQIDDVDIAQYVQG